MTKEDYNKKMHGDYVGYMEIARIIKECTYPNDKDNDKIAKHVFMKKIGMILLKNNPFFDLYRFEKACK